MLRDNKIFESVPKLLERYLNSDLLLHYLLQPHLFKETRLLVDWKHLCEAVCNHLRRLNVLYLDHST